MNHPHDDLLQRYLANLPEPAPPAALFGRIASSHRRRVQRRRLLRGGAGVALLLVLLMPLGLRRDAPLVAPAGTDLATLAPDPTAAALRRIDRQLQAAYDRGADADTLDALWLARERAALQHPPSENADEVVISL